MPVARRPQGAAATVTATALSGVCPAPPAKRRFCIWPMSQLQVDVAQIRPFAPEAEDVLTPFVLFCVLPFLRVIRWVWSPLSAS
jgi:hypothetical protein